MKKLIIAAGIAAATMASFGASAATYTSSASVNTVVTGTTGFVVSAADKSMDVDTFKTDKTILGTFTVTAPVGATTFALSDIHAHNYPEGYKVKIGGGSCVATLDVNGQYSAFGNSNVCDFASVTNVSQNLDVTNDGGFAGSVAPGVRTLTVKFTSEAN
ncbi:TPA: hypothetical protein O5C63_004470 [Salmonella enterica subsp. enterica serovar Mokola]|nr:hypothetical protein [Salmonella enterica subsp. enterica serovar Mokola]HDA4107142.1 hypothetical protein [Salmonella enterica subsp. enterica serovar Mokola]HDA4156842.1 hypothetical protein [Salmonella enterica subsp. enterica serovar Mokola]HDA4179709.1 hypothetical protein [Salmonella enterica subsp. enterica serovar Mokola]HDA4562029.1 hypothetical protein [Salmonella enterica subsp. enterica serovar Mokola]